MNLLKQPIIHFLLIGGLCFFGYDLLNPSPDARDMRKIVLDKQALLEYFQFRRKSFNNDDAEMAFDQMSVVELATLKQQYLRDEVLYREAKALQLDSSDFVIKQRLIQKMEYLLKGFNESEKLPTDSEVSDYYQQHKDEYYQSPRLTFTHVFIEKGSDLHKAKRILNELREKNIGPSEALAYGDRFLYHRNYVEQTPDMVQSHFGVQFVEELTTHIPEEETWFGPVTSDYGVHLIHLVRATPGNIPPLKDIYSLVVADLQKDREKASAEAAVAKLIEAYEIRDEMGKQRNPVAADSL